jgi:hypothetical protein
MKAVVGFVRRRTFVVGAVFALIALGALIGGRSATTSRGTRAPEAAPTGSLATASASRATPGGGSASTATARRGIARKGQLPRTVTRSRPRELHLTRAHDKVFDVRKLKSIVVRRERPEHQAPGFNTENELNPRTARAPVAKAGGLPQTIDPSSLAAAAPAPDSSFDGLDFATWGAGHPPDENSDVGPNYVIETVNTSIGIFDKSNGSRVAAFTFNTFMSQGNFGNLCDTNNFGDPVVLYDTYEDRWFITDFAFKLDGSGNVINPPGAFQCFAVSKTGDPVNGGWNFYSIAAPGALNDYPKFGVWPDGIYMSANLFGYPANGGFQGFHMWALNKQQMYAGAPSPPIVDFAGDTSDFTVIPANSRLQAGAPPAGSPEYFVSTEQFLNAQSVYKFHVDWDKISTSTFTGPATAAAATCWPNANPSNASTPANAADVLAIRAMAQAQYSNLGGAESLWVDHTVNRGEIPLASCPAANTNNATIRWYQINVTGGSVAANDVQGRSYDPEGANTFFRFVPALAVDRAGNLAITYTKSNSTTNPQIKYAGRLAGDPVNTLGQTEQTLIDGTGAQSGACGSSACTRWGDYAGMSLDPNGCEFWMTGEYYATNGLNDLTRIGSFHYPTCTPVGNGTLSGTVTDGSSPIAGATVALGNRTTATNGSGIYSFTVPAGTYASLTASKAGFDSASVSTIAVPDGGSATRNFTLNAAAQSGCFTDSSQTAFQRGVPVNCDLNASPGNVQLADQTPLDQKNESLSNSGTGINTTTWGGQTFTAGVSGQLTKADINLFCFSCTGTTPNLTLSVRATAGGLPTGSDLAAATIPGFSSGAAVYYSVTFASPITVTAGTQYALVIRPTANPSAGTYALTVSTGSQYAAGARVSSGNSGSTWTAATSDAGFHTYVHVGFPSSGTLVSSLKDANPAAGANPTWTTLSFSATTPAGTAVKFQLAGSNSQYGPFNFVGPDGTASTFFTTSGASLSPQFDGFRYLKYKAFLSTTNSSVTPTLSSVQVCFQDVAATSATSLAVDPATGTFGGTTTLSATLTSGGNPVSGRTVSFKLNGSSAGSAVTNASGVASESGVSLAGIDAGSYPTGVGASFAGDGSFDASSGSNSLTVSMADQTITFPQPADFTWLGGSDTLTATASSGLAVSYSVLSGPCSVSLGTLTANHAGSCVVAADQAGNGNYNAASQVTRTVTVQKADQAINVTTPAPDNAVFGDHFSVAADGGGSGNPVTFSNGGAGGACSNSDATFTMTSGTGTCSVMFDQAGDDDYKPATQVVETVNAQKADQTITVNTGAPASAVYNTQFTVAATAPGGAVSYSNGGVACSNSGAMFTMTSGTGTCSVKYDQAGDDDYNPATQVVETVNAQQADQTINVTATAPESKVYNASFGVAANASSGLGVAITTSGVCGGSGTGSATITMTSGTGTCTVHYNQAGNGNYNAATEVTEDTTAQPASQTIDFAALADKTDGDPDFTVSATASSGLAVSFTASGQCTVSGNTVHLTGPGSCTITAHQAGDSNYSAAADVPRTFKINSPASVSQITSTSTTCSQFSGGTAQTLGAAVYVVKGGKINKVTPSTIAYWVKVSVPSGPQSVQVDQAITSFNFTQKLTLATGSKVFTAACAKLKAPTFTAGPNGSVTAGFNAATAGTYLIEVLYKSSAANGQTAPTPTTVHFEFSTAGVSGSTSGLDLIKQGTAAPSARLASLFPYMRGLFR